MKCSKVSKMVYLFDELDQQEKQKIIAHLISCKACQELYQQVQTSQQITKNAFVSSMGSPEDQARLTNKIMKDILNTQRQPDSVIDLIFKYITYRPMQYGLGMISLFLVIFFIIELDPSQGPNRLRASNSVFETNPKVIELNSASFSKALRQKLQIEKPEIAAGTLTLYDCLKACKSNQDRHCSICKKKYPKLMQHETI